MTAGQSPHPSERRRTLDGRRLATLAVAGVAVVALVSGAVVLARGLGRRPGPAAVVGDYFAALAAGDAGRALSLGTVPSVPRGLLTDHALRAQLDLARLRDATVVSTTRDGGSATVEVGYTLVFAERSRSVVARLGLHERNGAWRLDRVASPVRVELTAARQRATLAGGALPDHAVLMFPGALPLRFDTPALRVTSTDAAVGTGSSSMTGSSTLHLTVAATDAGRRTAVAAVLAAVRHCLAGADTVTCPQPDERYVPGSLRGRVLGGLVRPDVSVLATDVGTLAVDATVPVDLSYRRLDFRGVAQSGSGRRTLAVHGLFEVTESPAVVRWTR